MRKLLLYWFDSMVLHMCHVCLMCRLLRWCWTQCNLFFSGCCAFFVFVFRSCRKQEKERNSEKVKTKMIENSKMTSSRLHLI